MFQTLSSLDTVSKPGDCLTLAIGLYISIRGVELLVPHILIGSPFGLPFLCNFRMGARCGSLFYALLICEPTGSLFYALCVHFRTDVR